MFQIISHWLKNLFNRLFSLELQPAEPQPEINTLEVAYTSITNSDASQLTKLEQNVTEQLCENAQPELNDIKAALASQWHQLGDEYLKVNNYSAAITAFDRALALNSNNPATWDQYSIALQNLGYHIQATEAQHTAKIICHENEQRQKAKPLFDQGIKELRAENYKESLDWFNKYLAINPDNHEAWYNRGLVLAGMKLYEEAVASLNLAIQQKPDEHKTWIIHSVVLDNLGWYEDALTSCEKALKIKPDDLDSLTLHGVVLSHLNRYDEAFTSFNKLKKIKPVNSLGFHYSIIMLANTKHYNEALALAQEASDILEDEEEKNDVWRIHLFLLLSMGREQELIALCENIPDNLIDKDSAPYIDKEIIVLLLRLILIFKKSNINLRDLFRLLCEAKPSERTGGIVTFGFSFTADTKVLLLNRKRLKKAFELLETTSEVSDNHARNFILLLGRLCILISLYQYDKALSLCKKTLENYSENTNFYLIAFSCQILILFYLKRYEEAFEIIMTKGVLIFETATEIHIDDSIRYLIADLFRCFMLTTLERYEEALAICENTSRVSYSYAICNKIILGCQFLIRLQQNRRENAFDLAQQVATKLDETPENLTKMSALISLAEVCSEKQFEETLPKLQRLRKVIENNLSKSDILELFQFTCFVCVNFLVLEERHKEVVAICEEYRETIAEHYQTLCIYGMSLSVLERYNEAIAIFDRALQIQPESKQAWRNRGVALHNLDRHIEAIASFDKALESTFSDIERSETKSEFPNSSDSNKNQRKDEGDEKHYIETWHNRGHSLFFCGFYEKAIASYDQALAIKADNHKAWISRGKAVLVSANYDPQLTPSVSLANKNTALNQRGYNGQLNSLRQGLIYCNSHKDTHVYSKGLLHHALGNAHYTQGQKFENPFPYYLKARIEYELALQILNPKLFLEQHLEVLQDLIRICYKLSDLHSTKVLRAEGSEGLSRLLQNTNSLQRKVELARKFASFDQLLVYELAQSPEPVKQIKALELAEERKNMSLHWLRYGYAETVEDSPKYAEIQQLLNFQTAAIYFHISLAAITIFILKQNQQPKVRILKADATSNGADKQLKKFEDWVENWKQYYKKANRTEAEKQQWIDVMPTALAELAKILNISEIVDELDDELQQIDNLILIPHRDLHLLPLHYLFLLYSGRDFTITHLPSVQIAGNLQRSTPSLKNITQIGSILSVEVELLFAGVESTAICTLYSPPKRKSEPNPLLNRIRAEEATKERVINALKTGADFFLFTGHAEHNIDYPNESALILAGKEPLTLREIFQLELPPCYLVCLSACETGLTSKEGLVDEFIGLTSAFLAKKTTHVISTLWRVNEVSAALLMIRFHQVLQKPDVTPASALREAQKWLRTITRAKLAEWYLDLVKIFIDDSNLKYINLLKEEANDLLKDSTKNSHGDNSAECPYQHPYHWAGFIITGIL